MATLSARGGFPIETEDETAEKATMTRNAVKLKARHDLFSAPNLVMYQPGTVETEEENDDEDEDCRRRAADAGTRAAPCCYNPVSRTMIKLNTTEAIHRGQASPVLSW